MLGAYVLFVVIAGRRGGVGACRRWFGGLPRFGLLTDARRGVGEARLTFFVNYILLFKPHLSSD
jgi:hypothetical protein